MKNALECSVLGDEKVIFGALVDVLQSYKNGDFHVWALKVSVNPSRFGVEEALSIRLRTGQREEEIGKVILKPTRHGQHLLQVPPNRTGGAKPPDLDPKGEYFHRVVKSLLARLTDLGLYNPP